MFIKTNCNKRFGSTLPEVLVASGIGAILGVSLLTLWVFSLKSFAGLVNYSVLDAQNREAMDHLTKEVRQARAVKDYVASPTGNRIVLINAQNQEITYDFNAANKQLTRQGGGSSKVLLENCDLLNFHLYQRNPSNANFGVFPVASGNWTQTVKVLQLTWKTEKKVPSGPVNSENIQTARVVIRKQQE